MSSSKCEFQNQRVLFSFDSVTHRKEFNLTREKKSKNLTREYSKLFERLSDLSAKNWLELSGLPKESGYEIMPLSSLNTDITDRLSETAEVAKDTKLYVFRFGNCRLVGYRSNACRATLHVLGCDWNFTLYTH